MRTDTDALKGYSASLRGLQSWGYRSSAAYGTHLEVQNSLNRLALWFETAATQAEQTETALASVTSVWKPGTMQVSHTEVWNLGQQLKKKPVTTTFSGTVSTSLAAARFTHSGAHHRFDTDVRVFDTQASGSVGLKLWDKKKRFSPEARIQAEASMSAACVTGNYRVFSGTGMSGSLRVRGETGAVYAKAEAVLSKDEQTLEASVGAAAFRGECSLAFSLLGCTVTITGEGSVGSCEAGLSYRHMNREWEFGSKLSFIAGTGFKVNVRY